MEKAIQDRTNRCIVFSVLIFSLAAHLYRWVNPLFNHDSLLVRQNDNYYVISLGRYLIPFYVKLRGKITAPWLLGMLSMVFLAVSIKMITDLLELKSLISITLICGLLSTCPVITIENSSYLSIIDIYMLSLMFALASVYFCLRYRHGWIISVVCVVISLGLYQSYIQAAAVVFLFRIIRDCIEDADPRTIIGKCVKYAGAVLLAGALYYASWKLVLSVRHVRPADLVNSVSGISDFSGYNLWELLKGAYMQVFRYFLDPLSFQPSWNRAANLALLVVTVVSLAGFLAGCRRRLVVVLLLLLSPLAADFVFILSKGYIYQLMMYPFVLLYLPVFLTFEVRGVLREKFQGRVYTAAEQVLLSVLFSFLIYDGIVYANQTYLERNLIESATLSAMTRVVDRMEQTDGYIPGETKVVFIGDLNDSAAAVDREGFSHIWFDRNFAPTHYWSYRHYFTYILGYPLLAASEYEISEFRNKPEVIEMPAFPAEGYCKMVDGCLVIKFSAQMDMVTTDYLRRND